MRKLDVVVEGSRMEIKFRAITGMTVTLILFSALIGMSNTPAVMTESIPTTEIIYSWHSGYAFPTPGIYVIATETNPVEMAQNYTNYSDYYRMLKEHATTEASTDDFISILISRGTKSSSGYGMGIESVEKMDYTFVLNANFTDSGPGVIVLTVITNPTALIPIGNLPTGEYSITLNIDNYRYDYFDGTWYYWYVGRETWTAAFKCSAGWITVKSHSVEMSIENITTPLGKDLSILMVAPMGALSSSSQIFDIYLYDSNYSLFSFWSQDKCFLCVLTSVPPGYNATLSWNLYCYDPATGKYFPPPPGNYYLVGAIMGCGHEPADVTPPILLKIDNFAITPIGGPHLRGDADLNGVVELTDFYIWRENYGKKSGECSLGAHPDFDENGLVEMPDFYVWRGNFGAT